MCLGTSKEGWRCSGVGDALTLWTSVLRTGDDHYGKRRVGDALIPWTSVLRRADDDDGKRRVGDVLTP